MYIYIYICREIYHTYTLESLLLLVGTLRSRRASMARRGGYGDKGLPHRNTARSHTFVRGQVQEAQGGGLGSETARLLRPRKNCPCTHKGRGPLSLQMPSGQAGQTGPQTGSFLPLCCRTKRVSTLKQQKRTGLGGIAAHRCCNKPDC